MFGQDQGWKYIECEPVLASTTESIVITFPRKPQESTPDQEIEVPPESSQKVELPAEPSQKVELPPESSQVKKRSMEDEVVTKKTRKQLATQKACPFYYVNNWKLIKHLKESLPSECLPSYSFGRIMGINPKSPNSNGLESWPITKTKFFKIGRDPSLCQVVIDYNAADDVHLILSNETNRVFESRFSATATTSSSAAASASKAATKTKTEKKEPARPPTASLRSTSRRASRQALPIPTLEPTASSASASFSELPAAAAEPSMALDLPLQDQTIMSESGSSSTAPVSEKEQEQDEKKTRDYGNQWYIRVLGSLGVYINNYHHSSSASRDESGDCLRSDMVPVKSGDLIRIGDWQGTLFFT